MSAREEPPQVRSKHNLRAHSVHIKLGAILSFNLTYLRYSKFFRPQHSLLSALEEACSAGNLTVEMPLVETSISGLLPAQNIGMHTSRLLLCLLILQPGRVCGVAGPTKTIELTLCACIARCPLLGHTLDLWVASSIRHGAKPRGMQPVPGAAGACTVACICGCMCVCIYVCMCM